MNIIGISAFYHDSAVCVVQDGKLVAACEEERLSRVKHDAGFPERALGFCLQSAGITLADVSCVAFYDKPLRKFRRLLSTYADYAPEGIESFLAAMPQWLGYKLAIGPLLRKLMKFRGKIVFTEHHEAHAASAFFPSPYESAAILTVDGVGEWAASSLSMGYHNDIELYSEQHFPHSVGLLYSAFTSYCGFKVNSGEYKLMGLAPYGEPRYKKLILERLGDFREDGSLWLDMKYFNYCQGLSMTSEAFHELFGGPPRQPESAVTQREMDLARSIQEVTEYCMLGAARHAHRETGESNLCLAGGVALNCVANGLLLREGPFTKIWVQPAAGDSGGALGAAFSAWHQYYRQPRLCSRVKDEQDRMSGTYLGPEFDEHEIRDVLEAHGFVYCELSREDLLCEVATRLAREQVVGWFQGRMEFGPRALGNRSILADPRSPRMQAVLNSKIKYRENFRPFAPAVLQERAAELFDIQVESPYMLFVASVNEALRISVSQEDEQVQGLDRLHVQRSTLPAITHVDYSARLQTVCRKTNPLFYDLITEFDRITGYPVLINTSFNVRGEPIVCTPEDAVRCFSVAQIDCLVIGNFLVERASVAPALVSGAAELVCLD